MKLYCRGSIVVATHDDNQNVDPALYAADVVITVPDDLVLERLGDAPGAGEIDTRPFAKPAITPGVLMSYAADKRWRVETGGCAGNGYVLATDRDSQSKLLAEFVAISGGIRTDPSPWKMADGEFVVLSNAQMGALVMAARSHIAAAFAAEAVVLAAIDAGTITTTAQIDAAMSG